ncbi:MAG: hypothetical protein ETSY1_43130 [Candidatus Entotheonella factor]|uniref:TauD/TfdA-like domain-containing protein n=1 Tax=Entotheonella factor TaxID=1429438 RepID=W4L3S4_ENTF1|nr:TauD/TfdA family dioxygenase [Candidatus Entotheonella palauensis]ETW92554.1 MAG: hypothetical protein ETSY1_43130 [Candidatus Entotheonella factor]
MDTTQSEFAPTITPLDAALGAEVTNCDLSHPHALSEASIAWVGNRLAEYAVLVFRDQALTAAQMDRFSRCFGVPQQHVLQKYRHPEIPEISYVTNVEADGSVDHFGVRRATMWHTDATYEPKLPRLAMLYALQVPTAGGGTYFADMRAAWDALDEPRRAQLQPLTGLHRFNVGPAGGAAIYAGQRGAEADAFEDQRHPAILKHPHSGRSILFTNPAHTYGFETMGRDDGWALVESLAEHATQAQFTYLHTWRPSDLVMWDELATIHRGAGDANPEEPRVLMRSIVYPA